MPLLPEIFSRQRQDADAIRRRSLETIEADGRLAVQFGAIDQAIAMFEHLSRSGTAEIRQQAVRHMNRTAAAVDLILSGYHQAAMLQLQDPTGAGERIEPAYSDEALRTSATTLARIAFSAAIAHVGAVEKACPEG